MSQLALKMTVNLINYMKYIFNLLINNGSNLTLSSYLVYLKS